MLKDVITLTHNGIEFPKDLWEKLYHYQISAKDRKKLDSGDSVQFIFKMDKITPMKTLKQLGYLHTELYFKAWLSYMLSEGKISEEEAIYNLKRDCGFIYENGCPKSMADATANEASLFIDTAFKHINLMGFVEVLDSKEWKNKPKIKIAKKEK